MCYMVRQYVGIGWCGCVCVCDVSVFKMYENVCVCVNPCLIVAKIKYRCKVWGIVICVYLMLKTSQIDLMNFNRSNEFNINTSFS